MKNKISLILTILIIFLVPLLLYFYNFNNIVFDEEFYKKEFLKYGVYEALQEYDIDKINKDLLDYLRNKNDNLNTKFFNQRELDHLKDVKTIFNFLSLIYYFSIILALTLFIFIFLLNKTRIKKIIAKIFLFSGILTFFYSFVFWLLSKLNFQLVFDTMHKLFFKAGTYVFDPSYEKIVILYPQQIFYDISIMIGIKTLIISAILILIGSLILFKDKIKKYLNKIKK